MAKSNGSNGTELLTVDEIEEKLNPFNLYMQQAYKWYNDLKHKQNKTPEDISRCIFIEERHKNNIVQQFQEYLLSHPEVQQELYKKLDLNENR